MPRSAAPPVSARAKEPGSGATFELGFETQMLLLEYPCDPLNVTLGLPLLDVTTRSIVAGFSSKISDPSVFTVKTSPFESERPVDGVYQRMPSTSAPRSPKTDVNVLPMP